MTRPIGVAVLAALFFSCPNVKQQPVHQRADNAQYPVAQISNSTADVPILESPDPMKREISAVRTDGFTGLIRVRSDIDIKGKVTRCEVEAELPAARKEAICNADRARNFRTPKAFNLVETFVPPSLH